MDSIAIESRLTGDTNVETNISIQLYDKIP